MPNRYQVGYIVSFFATFFSLVGAATYIRAKLRDAGYNIGDLILIGLPKNRTDVGATDASPPQPSPAMQNIAEFASSPYAQLLALALAVGTTAFIWLKFGKAARKPVLDPKEWKEFPLVKKTIVSPNTALYRFALPHPEDTLGLPIGQHISVQAHIAGQDIQRSYTPTSSNDDKGHLDLLIKSYEKGNISRWFSLLKIGDTVRVKGPKGQFKYVPTLCSEIGMVAGGTGITPMLQIVRAALKNPQDRTKISLIYANVNVEDILLKKELDGLAAAHANRFRVYYVLNNPPEGWQGGVGFVTKEMIEKHMPSTNHNIKVLMCGPPPMMQAMKKHLAELNYPAPRTVSKLDDQVFLF